MSSNHPCYLSNVYLNLLQNKMEFTNLIRITDDFVLKSNHLRHELQNDELFKFESNHGDICVLFCILVNNKAFDMAIKFLKSIRDIDAGPYRFVGSASFESAFLSIKTSMNDELQLKLLEIIQKASLQCLSKELSSSMLQQFCEWMCSENPLLAEAAGNASLKFCLLYPALGVPVLMRTVRLHSGDSTIEMRFAYIIGSLLNPTKHIALLVNNNVSSAAFSVQPANELFDVLVEQGAVAFLIGMSINSNDILVQIIALEIISEFAGSEKSVSFLFHEKLFSWLVNRSAVLLDKSGDHMLYYIKKLLNVDYFVDYFVDFNNLVIL